MILRCPDRVSLARAAAENIVKVAGDAVGRRGFFTIALSGGHSPRGLFSALASAPFKDELPWDRTFVFQTDERCVPPDDPSSNFRDLHDMLLSRVPVTMEHIFRIRGELAPDEAAEDYDGRMMRFFETRNGMKDGFPVFDLIVLGVGGDGHTASLFPGCPAPGGIRRAVVPARAPERYAPEMRVTLTLPVINNAAGVFFLVPGMEKRNIMLRLFEPGKPATDLPAARVDPPGGCTFFTDFDL